MQIQKIVDEFYTQYKSYNQLDQDILNISYKNKDLNIDLNKFFKEYSSYINILISEFNKGLGMSGKYNPNAKILAYKKVKSNLINKLYSKFIKNFIICKNCNLKYTKFKDNQVICIACGFTRDV
jgi:translation initiation factor 2 beta subunit (eIF-2beta)/eIF-5